MSVLADGERAYRQALGCFATGVALVTTDTPAGVAGIVVNSFASVSLRPRLVLWCLGDTSDRFPHFSRAATWGINVLSAGQQGLAAEVAQAGAWLLDGPPPARLGGAPVVPGSLARLACRTTERRAMGDHLVIVGEVEAFEADAGDGLTYFRGRFGAASMET